jgi:hypothetical protein
MIQGKKPIIYAFIDGQNLKMGTGLDLFNRFETYKYLLDTDRVKLER